MLSSLLSSLCTVYGCRSGELQVCRLWEINSPSSTSLPPTFSTIKTFLATKTVSLIKSPGLKQVCICWLGSQNIFPSNALLYHSAHCTQLVRNVQTTFVTSLSAWGPWTDLSMALEQQALWRMGENRGFCALYVCVCVCVCSYMFAILICRGRGRLTRPFRLYCIAEFW